MGFLFSSWVEHEQRDFFMCVIALVGVVLVIHCLSNLAFKF